MELEMSSQLATRLPVSPGSVESGRAARSERPVVPYDLAKLAVLFIALLVLSPAWVETMGSLINADPPAWGALRLLVVAGGAGLVALALAFLYVWVDLIKRLARQN
jgi:pilus assembly protein TadC